MKLSDLKQGHRVKLREGTIYLILEKYPSINFILLGENGEWQTGRKYNENMRVERGGSYAFDDIMEVYPVLESGFIKKLPRFFEEGEDPIWTREEISCPHCKKKFDIREKRAEQLKK